jgi:hypothetical protein
MVIVMSEHASQEDVQRVIEEIERRGYQSHPIFGDTRTIVGVGSARPSSE